VEAGGSGRTDGGLAIGAVITTGVNPTSGVGGSAGARREGVDRMGDGGGRTADVGAALTAAAGGVGVDGFNGSADVGPGATESGSGGGGGGVVRCEGMGEGERDAVVGKGSDAAVGGMSNGGGATYTAATGTAGTTVGDGAGGGRFDDGIFAVLGARFGTGVGARVAMSSGGAG
jgi:hypothetical protein